MTFSSKQTPFHSAFFLLTGVISRVLLDVQEVANRGAARGKLFAFFLPSVDSDKIKECRERLQRCLDKFGVGTNPFHLYCKWIDVNLFLSFKSLNRM